MSLTYPADTTTSPGEPVESPRADLAHDAPFVPVYARRGKARGGQGKIRAWMILVPVGVLTLGGIAAMMAMNGGDEASVPLVEPAGTLPVLPATPVSSGPELAPLSSASTPSPVVAAPQSREATPAARAAPAPARRSTAPAATPRAQTPDPVVATGPQPYAPAPAGPSTSALNSTPPAPAPTAPTPPVVIVEPAG